MVVRVQVPPSAPTELLMTIQDVSIQVGISNQDEINLDESDSKVYYRPSRLMRGGAVW